MGTDNGHGAETPPASDQALNELDHQIEQLAMESARLRRVLDSNRREIDRLQRERRRRIMKPL